MNGNCPRTENTVTAGRARLQLKERWDTANSGYQRFSGLPEAQPPAQPSGTRLLSLTRSDRPRPSTGAAGTHRPPSAPGTNRAFSPGRCHRSRAAAGRPERHRRGAAAGRTHGSWRGGPGVTWRRARRWAPRNQGRLRYRHRP